MPISSKLFSSAPNKPAVYCLIERNDVIYVGISKNLRDRLRQHFVRKDSSITTGTSAASLNPEYVDQVSWWSHDSFSNRDKLEAAEIVAFEIFNPILRSRGNLTDGAKAMLTKNYEKEMTQLFKAKSSGKIFIPTMQDLIDRIEKLETPTNL